MADILRTVVTANWWPPGYPMLVDDDHPFMRGVGWDFWVEAQKRDSNPFDGRQPDNANYWFPNNCELIEKPIPLIMCQGESVPLSPCWRGLTGENECAFYVRNTLSSSWVRVTEYDQEWAAGALRPASMMEAKYYNALLCEVWSASATYYFRLDVGGICNHFGMWTHVVPFHSTFSEAKQAAWELTCEIDDLFAVSLTTTNEASQRGMIMAVWGRTGKPDVVSCSDTVLMGEGWGRRVNPPPEISSSLFSWQLLAAPKRISGIGTGESLLHFRFSPIGTIEGRQGDADSMLFQVREADDPEPRISEVLSLNKLMPTFPASGFQDNSVRWWATCRGYAVAFCPTKVYFSASGETVLWGNNPTIAYAIPPSADWVHGVNFGNSSSASERTHMTASYWQSDLSASLLIPHVSLTPTSDARKTPVFYGLTTIYDSTYSLATYSGGTITTMYDCSIEMDLSYQQNVATLQWYRSPWLTDYIPKTNEYVDIWAYNQYVDGTQDSYPVKLYGGVISRRNVTADADDGRKTVRVNLEGWTYRLDATTMDVTPSFTGWGITDETVCPYCGGDIPPYCFQCNYTGLWPGIRGFVKFIMERAGIPYNRVSWVGGKSLYNGLIVPARNVNKAEFIFDASATAAQALTDVLNATGLTWGTGIDGSLIIWPMVDRFSSAVGYSVVSQDSSYVVPTEADDERNGREYYNEILVRTADLKGDGIEPTIYSVAYQPSVSDPDSALYLGGYRTKLVDLNSSAKTRSLADIYLRRWMFGKDRLTWVCRNADVAAIPRATVTVNLPWSPLHGETLGVVQARYWIERSGGLPRLVSSHVAARDTE